MDYETWAHSDRRDQDPIVLMAEQSGKILIAYDRFAKAFVLTRSRKILPLEQFREIFDR